MAEHSHAGRWQVEANEGRLNLKTGRIGILRFNATAPIVGGEADWSKPTAELTVEIGIDQVDTGNRLMDSQVRNLVSGGSDGVLTFKGEGHVSDDEVSFEGRAWSGDVEVPMSLSGQPVDVSDEERDLNVSGTATFTDVHIPLPGLSHINKIDISVEGVIRLKREK